MEKAISTLGSLVLPMALSIPSCAVKISRFLQAWHLKLLIQTGGYADGGSNEALELDTDYVLAKNSPDNLTFAEEWSGSCVLNVTDLNNPSVIFNAEKEISGVEGIETEVNNAPAVYYNLQGVRVANAENGLFIVKKGNKVSKVFVK